MSRYSQQTKACSALQIRLRPGVTCVCPAHSEFEMPFTKQKFLCKGNFEKKIFWKIRNGNSMSSSRFYHCVSAIRFREFNQSKIWSNVIWQYLAFSLPESDLELALHFYLVFCDKLASFPRFWMTLEKHSEITKCSNIKIQTKQTIYYNGWEHMRIIGTRKLASALLMTSTAPVPVWLLYFGEIRVNCRQEYHAMPPFSKSLLRSTSRSRTGSPLHSPMHKNRTYAPTPHLYVTT